VENEFLNNFKETIGIFFLNRVEIIQIYPNYFLAPNHGLALCLIPYFGLNQWPSLKEKQEAEKHIYIYEDQWNSKPEIILSRLRNAFGFSQKIAARSCVVQKIDKKTAAHFFIENHLLGACSAAYSYGLFYKNKLVLAASFSKSRVMIDGAVYYRSYEFIRFASEKNTLVVGGFQKILQHFIKEKNAVHLMTYIDLNFGDGKSFEKFGFKKIGSAQLQKFFINPTSHERWSLNSFENLENKGFEPIVIEEYSTQKMILDLR
jgi:hypothetical protein